MVCGARQYDILYQPCTATKSQILANFLTKFNMLTDQPTNNSTTRCSLCIDRSLNFKGRGIGILLRVPTRELTGIPIQLQFNTTNNVDEYEAFILWMQLALHLEA